MYKMLYLLYFDYLSILLIFVCCWGLLINRTNLLIILLLMELIFIIIGFRSIFLSFLYDDLLGQIIVFFIITIAACESVIGLVVIVVYYRLRGTLDLNLINVLKT